MKLAYDQRREPPLSDVINSRKTPSEFQHYPPPPLAAEPRHYDLRSQNSYIQKF